MQTHDVQKVYRYPTKPILQLLDMIPQIDIKLNINYVFVSKSTRKISGLIYTQPLLSTRDFVSFAFQKNTFLGFLAH